MREGGLLQLQVPSREFAGRPSGNWHQLKIVFHSSFVEQRQSEREGSAVTVTVHGRTAAAGVAALRSPLLLSRRFSVITLTDSGNRAAIHPRGAAAAEAALTPSAVRQKEVSG